MIRLGRVTVQVSDAYTITVFGDGSRLVAQHAEQDGQRETARELGFQSAWEMNRTHDLSHSLLAHWLGLPHSPTLFAVAHGDLTAEEIWRREEAAVLAIQSFARSMNVDLVRLAEKRK